MAAEEVVAEEVVAEGVQPRRVEEPTQMRNYSEENPNTLKEIDEMSIDSLQTSSLIST